MVQGERERVRLAAYRPSAAVLYSHPVGRLDGDMLWVVPPTLVSGSQQESGCRGMF